MGVRVTCHPDALDKVPGGKGKVIFVNSMSDTFHEGVPFDFIMAIFATVYINPQHQFLMLTKRPDRMLLVVEEVMEHPRFVAQTAMDTRYFNAFADPDLIYDGIIGTLANGPLPNLALGVTAENQAAADERIPLLKQCPAAMRFVSVEPMLEGINLFQCGALHMSRSLNRNAKAVAREMNIDSRRIRQVRSELDWVIAGAESGPKRRHIDVNDIRGLRDQCMNAGTPFMLKQMQVGGKLTKMPELDGKVWDERPQS